MRSDAENRKRRISKRGLTSYWWLVLPHIILLLYVSFLLYGLLSQTQLGLFKKIMENDRFVSALITSLYISFLASLISIIIAVPIGYAVSREIIPGNKIIESIGLLLLSSPPVGIGIMILIFLETTLLGKRLDEIAGFVYSWKGIVLAQLTVIFPIVLKFVKEIFDYVDVRLEQHLMTLGATPLKAFVYSTLPIALPGIIASWIIGWLRSLGEFGATVVISGNIPYHTETLPVFMYNLLSRAELGGASVVLLFSLMLSLTGLVLYAFLIEKMKKNLLKY